MNNFAQAIKQIEAHVEKINEQTERLKLIEKKVKWHKHELNVLIIDKVDMHYLSNYTGD